MAYNANVPSGTTQPAMYLADDISFDADGNIYDQVTGQPTGAVLTTLELGGLLNRATLPAGDTGPGAQAKAAALAALSAPQPTAATPPVPVPSPGAQEQGFMSENDTLVYLAGDIYFDTNGIVYTQDGIATGGILTPAQVQALMTTGQLPAGTSIYTPPLTIDNGIPTSGPTAIAPPVGTTLALPSSGGLSLGTAGIMAALGLGVILYCAGDASHEARAIGDAV